MRPDRVVGLRKTERFQRNIASSPAQLNHCPVRDVDMLYPFLVVEAKRENDAPGFRSVERQTAFPLRRFLKLQDALKTASSKNLDPLVWFFAYQGEVWRLYAGTIVDSNFVMLALFSRANGSLTRIYSACIRPLARHNRVVRWCIAAFPDRRLHLDLGPRHLPSSDSKLPAWPRR